MTFDTSDYERSHGKKPRGHGYWAFTFPYAPAHLKGQTFFETGTLTECKRKLKAKYPFVKTVKVMS